MSRISLSSAKMTYKSVNDAKIYFVICLNDFYLFTFQIYLRLAQQRLVFFVHLNVYLKGQVHRQLRIPSRKKNTQNRYQSFEIQSSHVCLFLILFTSCNNLLKIYNDCPHKKGQRPTTSRG